MFPGQTARVIDGNRNAIWKRDTHASTGFPTFPIYTHVWFPSYACLQLSARMVFLRSDIRDSFLGQLCLFGGVILTQPPPPPPERDVRKGFDGHLAQPFKVMHFFKEPCAISLKHILCDNKDVFLGHHMQPRLWSSTLTFRHPVTNFRIREFKCLSPTDRISSTVIFETMRPIFEH
jgi:hypothetical protein